MERYGYLVGGRLGDFIHVLYVIYINYRIHQVEGDIYLTDALQFGAVPFQYPLRETKKELEEFLSHCAPYVKNIYLLEENPIDKMQYKKIVNLNDWRSRTGASEWLLRLHDTYDVPICSDAWCMPSPTWVVPPINSKYIVLHRSLRRHNPSFPWEAILKNLETLSIPIYFITCDVCEYMYFPYKERVELKKCNTLLEKAYWISHAHIVVGNQSAPMAMSLAFGKKSIVELHIENMHDSVSYMNTLMAQGQVFYYLNESVFRTIKYT